MVVTMDYTDLCFSNQQLLSLVQSAEIIFRHLYDTVSSKNKVYINDWLCFKQEYDESCTNTSQFDVNENIKECLALTRIDEVSENEKLSSSSSMSTSLDSCTSLESVDLKNNDELSRVATKSTERTSKIDNQLSQIDSDLTQRMHEFKLVTDSLICDWFRTVSFDMPEIKKFTNWVENKDYERIWSNINDSREVTKLYGYVHNETFSTIDKERGFVPIQRIYHGGASNDEFQKKIDSQNPCAFAVPSETFFGEHLLHLYMKRDLLLRERENLLKKQKEDDLKSETEFEQLVKVDVAIEIIDISIEMKNHLKLGHSLQDLNMQIDEVDVIIASCLRILSPNETRHLLMTFLINFIDMRKNGFERDMLFKAQEIGISRLKLLLVEKRFIISKLSEGMFKDKRSCQNYFLMLQKEFMHMLPKLPMGQTTFDENNEKAMKALQTRRLSICEKNDQDSSHSDAGVSDSENLQTAVSCIPDLQKKHIKSWRNNSIENKVTCLPGKIRFTNTSNH